MSVSHVSQDEPTRVDVWTVLKELPQRVQALLKRHEASQELGFEGLEQELHALFTHAECAATSEALEREDVDLPYVFIDAEKHHRVYRGEKTYLCAVGPVAAMRTLYRARPGERAVAAVERKVGIVEGYWTAHAARQGAMLTAHLVPREAEEVLGVLGNMTPSKSSLDRLPKALSARWEAQRPQFEARVREDTLEVADTACTVAVSLDGVMAPMKTGGGGYREASCASVSLYDGEGERLSTVRMARMPESKKVTLKTMVGAEVEAVLGQRPDLQLVKIADGANDNWTFLSRVLPEGVELIDFFHAAEHLSDAFDAAYGANDPKAVAQFEKYRHLLRYDDDGVAQVIRALRHLRSKHPECERVAQVLGYFRNNRHRMGYAEAKDQGLPIGSGVVEATCKTLVTERLKRSGMRWSERGGQAILTLRALFQSHRFESGWSLLLQTYRAEVSAPDNVVPLRRPRIH